MQSLILQIATRLLVPILLVFSVFMLLRGHNLPGGGFVGGLVAASAFVLYALAVGVDGARRVLRIEPRTLLGTGLALALGAGLLALGTGNSFLQSLWLKVPLPGLDDPLKLGSTLAFDIGVMFVVVGTVLLMVFSVEDRVPGLIDD
ncbi:Na(+)/H(+) antiporter subunit B [Longibacter salinarum]|uniref:Na(+)/H(+) antiporter subunit B n=1 Tax=Longibacter salinarum TaxID=1850348 RepID=A0A2A8CWG3_9BACT|nr:Na(+)/H(+) antiporter subunit B [Longibacter salinarum]